MVDAQNFNLGGLTSNIIPAGTGTALLNGAVWFFIVIGIILVMGGVVIAYYYKGKYNQKINVWRRVAGKIQRTSKYMGGFIRIGHAGDKILFVKGLKKYLPTPTIQSAPNEWDYFISEDGEWINFEWQDIDEERRRMKCHFVDFDMRMSRLATEKTMAQLFKQKKWWVEYMPVISACIFILIACIGMAIVFHEWRGVQIEGAKAYESARQVAEAVNNLANQYGTTQLHTAPPSGG